ncbi:MAG: hypothetical protein ACQEQM_07800 [Thermoplasmatota archaeon]
MIFDRKGIFSLYDAVLFFVFLMIAASVLTVYSSNRLDTIQERSYSQDYCEHTRRAILSSTIPDTGYNYSQGFVNRTDMTVRALLIEQLYLESLGIERENFTYTENISEMVNDHIQKRYDWYLEVSSDFTEDMVISSDGLVENTDFKENLDNDVLSSSWFEEGLREEKIIITLYLTK